MTKYFWVAACTAAAFACGGDKAPTETGGDGASLQFVNATRTPLNISIDGVRVTTGLAVSGLVVRSVSPGAHTVRLEATGSPATDVAVTATQGIAVTTVVQAGIEGELEPSVLADTAATPAPGKTKLRVLHMAGTAPAVDIWRTQPDFATPTRVMFPFPYMAESSYLQSDTGTWTVFVTPVGDANTKLAESGPIAAASGEVKTVVLVDSAGVLRIRFTNDR